MSLDHLSPRTEQQQLRGECRTSPPRNSSPICELDFALRSQQLRYEQNLLDLNRRILRLETDKTQLEWRVKRLSSPPSREGHLRGVRKQLRRLRAGLAAIRDAWTSQSTHLTHFFVQSLQCVQEICQESHQRYRSQLSSLQMRLKQPEIQTEPTSPREPSSPEELRELRHVANVSRMIDSCGAMQCLHCGSLFPPQRFHRHILSCRVETIASPARGKSTEARLRMERNQARLEAERLLLQLKSAKVEWALLEERREERALQQRTLLRRAIQLLRQGDSEGALEQLNVAEHC